MFQFLRNIRISANTEIVCLLILGILFQISDGSPFQIKQQLEAVWSTDLPKEHFSPLAQQIIKTVLSIIVAVRCGTTSPYVVSAMIVIFCVLKDRAPKLMLLWLLIAAVKSVFMTFLEALTGVYVCSAFGKIRKACIEFFISKALEIIFAAYLWGSVLTIYQDMERRMENNKVPSNFEISYFKKLDFKRQRARSLVDESTLYKTACLNKFEFRDVPQIILQMLRRTDEISQDSLLGPGMMLASVSNMGSFDNLKVSESLGELGYTNLASTEVMGMDDEENLSPPEKALKFLKMTWSDVRRIRQNRVPLTSDIFSMNSDIWVHTSTNTNINKPKEPRTEVCIRVLPQIESEEDRLFSKKRVAKLKGLKLGMSLFNLIKKLESETEHEESLIENEEEEEEREEGEEGEEKEDSVMSQIFMSNMKEEKPVNRIRLFSIEKRVRGMSYYKCYTKDFMSVIGPEVFDRAPKLVKVTSFSVINSGKKNTPLETSSSIQESKIDLPLEDSASEKVWKGADAHAESEISSGVTNIKQEKESSTEIPTMESVKKSDKMGKNEPETKKSEPKNLAEKEAELPLCSPPEDVNLDKKSQTKFRSTCHRKRRVIIRRIGKSKKSTLTESVSTNSGLSNASHETFKRKSPLEANPKDENIRNYKLKTSISSISSEKSKRGEDYSENEELRFVAELLRKPLPEVVTKYCDLKHKMHPRKTLQVISKKQLEFVINLYKLHYLKRFQEMWYSSGKRNKVWKSKVLKTAETQQQPISANFLKSWDQDVTNKLLRYQYLYLTYKLKENIIHDMLPYINVESESSQNQDGQQQTSTKSNSKKQKKAVASLSANSSQESILVPENSNEILHANDNYLNETPSERSIEVCLKDLTVEETQSSEQNSESYSYEGSKTPLEKTELLELVKDGFLHSEESDEPISLYYSKAANLASPLLDMKKFIYPDHVHYSYKHVKKKGFDVNIDEALPLLVQNQPVSLSKPLKKCFPKPEFEIKSRPMDLSFAKTNAFGWDSDETVSEPSTKKETSYAGTTAGKGMRKYSRKRGSNGGKMSYGFEEHRSPKNSHQVYFAQNYSRLMKMQNRLKGKEKRSAEYSEEEITPVRISSTQLHSNKGRISSTYSPALRLAENKKEENKKTETKEKRKKDMLARLERQILFQNKNGFTSRKPL